MGAILRSGFESGDLAAEGWTTLTTGTLPEVVSSLGTINPRKDLNTFGGSYFLARDQNSSAAFNCVKPCTRSCREGFIKVALNVTTVSSIANSGLVQAIGGGVRMWSSFFQSNNTIINFTRSTFPTVLTTDVGSLQADSVWHVYHVHFYVDDSDGFFRVYKDFDFDNPIGVGTSLDNKNGTNDFIDALGIKTTGRNGGAGDPRTSHDDIACNDITMTYSGGVGTIPAVGDTILGQTSSARAIITALLPGSTAVAGTLQLRAVQDSGLVDWTGIEADDPFATETIDDSLSSNLWTASITGMDKNSGFPSNGFIIGLQPNGDVAGKIQLSNTGGGSNFADVDDIPPDTVDYVFTSTSGNRDVYELEDLASAGLTPGDISSISTVMVSTYWQKSDATLNTGKIIVEDSGVEYDSAAKSPPLGAYGHDSELYDKIPDGTPTTSTDWNTTNVDSLRAGIKFET